MNILFRIDDVSVNTDLGRLENTVGFIRSQVPEAKIMLAISPMVHAIGPGENKERTFPAMLHVQNDHREFYKVERSGVPKVGHLADVIAAHGLVHVDHRLMTRSAQELSIVASCSLVGTKTFVPPFHKWNEKTEQVCSEFGIDLIRWNSTWIHLKYHNLKWLGAARAFVSYYFHLHDFKDHEEFCSRFTQQAD